MNILNTKLHLKMLTCMVLLCSLVSESKLNAQIDSFIGEHSIWNVRVTGSSVTPYNYELHVIQGVNYYTEFVVDQWENYDDSAWNIIVDHTDKSIVLNKKIDVFSLPSLGTVNINPEIFYYFEEVNIDLEEKLDSTIDKTFISPSCQFGYQTTNSSMTASGIEKSFAEHCLISHSKAPKEYINEYLISIDENSNKLNKRFDGYQIIYN